MLRNRIPPLLLSCLLAISSSAFATTPTAIKPPKNVIGFFQSFDSNETWFFNGKDEDLAHSGYTILVDAFWTNYPFCWGDGSGKPGLGSPIPACFGVVNAPGPGTSNTLDEAFWLNYQGIDAPASAGDAYNNYWTSLHTSGPGVISKLRSDIEKISKNTITHQKIKLLAGIGGWNMGGSAEATPIMPAPPSKPAWAALLEDPDAFAIAMSNIMQLKVKGVRLYDGIDIDLETLYGLGCANEICTDQDKNKALENLVRAMVRFKTLQPSAILSTSPRASDISCLKKYCDWNNSEGLGFMGVVLQKMAAQKVYFDEINPQFYNDDGARNLPNGESNGTFTYGFQVIDMLKKLKETGAIGPNTSLNIGVLSQTNNHQTDTGGAPSLNNPGVAKESIQAFWALLQNDPALLATGVKIDGIMTWSANLALNNSGIGGNVRAMDSPLEDVTPYDWPAQLFNSKPLTMR